MKSKYNSNKSFAGRCVPVILLFLLLAASSRSWAAPAPKLPPIYDHWVNEDVNYLITDDERQAFVNLKTDEDRDKFIDTFWRIRNPDPGAPTNAAKEAHYARLAYANANYGYGNIRQGWRSDRGLAYITLGAPKQIEKYPETRELKPIQIWFYENLDGALPVHFYVLFYKQSPAEDYEFYSPYGDRPQKLVNSTNAVNDDRTAIKLVTRDINEEVAHIALSFIPGEPVDLKNPAPSLESDVLLNNIRNYRNLPQIREMVAARRAAVEGVSHRLTMGDQTSNLAVIATRDTENQASIHYLFRMLHPSDLTISEQSGGRYYYSLQVETTITDVSGKVVSKHKESLTDFVPEKMFDEAQEKCFGLEGRVLAPAGRYKLTVSVTNVVTKQAFEQSRDVLVPGAEDRIGISQVFFADSMPPRTGASVSEPFSFSGVRLQPIGSDNAQVTQGKPLRIIYQVWTPPGSPSELRGKQLKIHYMIGRMNTPGRQEEDQVVDRGSISPQGNLLMGKDLSTDALVPGPYRLVIKVTDPETSATAFQSLNFNVQDRDHPVAELWTIDASQTNR